MIIQSPKISINSPSTVIDNRIIGKARALYVQVARSMITNSSFVKRSVMGYDINIKCFKNKSFISGYIDISYIKIPPEDIFRDFTTRIVRESGADVLWFDINFDEDKQELSLPYDYLGGDPIYSWLGQNKATCEWRNDRLKKVVTRKAYVNKYATSNDIKFIGNRRAVLGKEDCARRIDAEGISANAHYHGHAFYVGAGKASSNIAPVAGISYSYDNGRRMFNIYWSAEGTGSPNVGAYIHLVKIKYRMLNVTYSTPYEGQNVGTYKINGYNAPASRAAHSFIFGQLGYEFCYAFTPEKWNNNPLGEYDNYSCQVVRFAIRRDISLLYPTEPFVVCLTPAPVTKDVLVNSVESYSDSSSSCGITSSSSSVEQSLVNSKTFEIYGDYAPAGDPIYYNETPISITYTLHTYNLLDTVTSNTSYTQDTEGNCTVTSSSSSSNHSLELRGDVKDINGNIIEEVYRIETMNNPSGGGGTINRQFKKLKFVYADLPTNTYVYYVSEIDGGGPQSNGFNYTSSLVLYDNGTKTILKTISGTKGTVDNSIDAGGTVPIKTTSSNSSSSKDEALGPKPSEFTFYHPTDPVQEFIAIEGGLCHDNLEIYSDDKYLIIAINIDMYIDEYNINSDMSITYKEFDYTESPTSSSSINIERFDNQTFTKYTYSSNGSFELYKLIIRNKYEYLNFYNDFYTDNDSVNIRKINLPKYLYSIGDNAPVGKYFSRNLTYSPKNLGFRRNKFE